MDTPMVVTYRMNRLTFAMARRLVQVEHVALVNLVAGRRVVPERIQDQATPESLSDALLPFLDESSEARQRVIAELAGVRAALQPPDRGGFVADRVAGLAAEILS
jgi:lipid-A-disaccharide synthase